MRTRHATRPLRPLLRRVCRVPLFAALTALVAGLLTLNAVSGAQAATGTPLRGDGLYPRAIRLEHSGAADGVILTSVVTFDAGDGVGVISQSTDDGRTFAEVGRVRAPDAAGGEGLCCSTLYELPQAVGDLPAGTLLWAASVGQDASPRRMSLQVFRSDDVGRTWSYLSTVAASSNDEGLWEPEFSLAADGQLAAHYSDETDPAHSQKLVAARTADGVHWTGHHDTVASALASDRPGMAVVRELPSGAYVMTYEICTPGGQYACVVHYRTSPDGWNWGDPASLGIRPETPDGQYFRHAPTLAWAPLAGSPQGRLFLVGQELVNADGARADGSGRTVWVNDEGGEGAWRAVAAPVAVQSQQIDYCPNYSSALLPSDDGTRLFEVATDWDGAVCRPYYAQGAV
ncbi:exo-alpha-sialidase [Streptomyces sp. NPDC046985]|uniref:exo-alpha-sialidase n=1 Tax=Streptomyces sp. NPDC046985 TaxID=3155377 RepID=UPI0033D3659E